MDNSHILNEELYKYIPPPIPLIPKNMYINDFPVSHQPLLTNTQPSSYNQPNENPSQKIGPNSVPPFIVIPSKTFSSYLENKPIVYRRDPKSNSVSQDLLNLSRFFLVEKPPRNTEKITPYYSPAENDETLVFESRFECGNLWMAAKASEFEYDLILQNDINTKGHTQWFYFRVTNTRLKTVKFNIVNLSKPGSLYNFGMKVLISSEKAGGEWFRGGEQISYFANDIKKGKKGKGYFTMSFSYQFSHDNDTVFFAYSHPFTFTDLMKSLQGLEEDNFKKIIVKRRLLCLSIAGNRCDYLTITAPGSPEAVKSRKGAVISARVHPGETVGSWMMSGVIDFLTGESAEAQLLRENFVFKIIPMLNPDGVINGNYRCNLAGVDLNRQWKDPNKSLHPTIFAAKKMIKLFSREREVALICDLHGHSRRKNIFIYGCSDEEQPALTREFPYILSKLSQYFSYKSCSFKMQKSKESTLRISIYKETKVNRTYTLESSFCGCDFGPTAGMHLTTNDLKNMGKELCLALIIDNGLKVPNTLLDKTSLIEELNQNKDLLQESEEMSDSGSDSDPSEDNLDQAEFAKILASKEKKRFSSDVKPKKKAKNNLKSFQISFKKNKEKTEKIVLKCFNCGEAKEKDHVCLKKKQGNTLTSGSKFSAMKIRKDLQSRNLSSLSQSANVFPVYLNHEGKRVRDQATQTTAIVMPKKDQIGVQGLGQDSSIISTNSSYRKSEGMESVGVEKLRSIFKEKKALPIISSTKTASEKFVITF